MMKRTFSALAIFAVLGAAGAAFAQTAALPAAAAAAARARAAGQRLRRQGQLALLAGRHAQRLRGDLATTVVGADGSMRVEPFKPTPTRRSTASMSIPPYPPIRACWRP